MLGIGFQGDALVNREQGRFFPAWHTECKMDMALADLIRFNEFLDSAMHPKNLDEEFITSRQVELEKISKTSAVKHFPLIALSYAKLMELTVFLAGTYSDNGQISDFGDLAVNPRHIDVCILNTGFIKEEYGIADSIPLWFKRQVQESIGSQYSEDLGKMVVDPSLLSDFIEKGLVLRTVKKERHKRLSDQFRGYITAAPQPIFHQYIENVTSTEQSPANVLGCGRGRVECLDIASWLAGSTVLNVVKGSLKTDLMDVLSEVISDDYLNSLNKKFDKAFDALHYVSIGRKNFDNFPYDEGVRTAEWDEINHTLCHFTLDGYGVIQSELNKSLSDPCYRSPFLNGLLYNAPGTQDTSRTEMIRNFM